MQPQQPQEDPVPPMGGTEKPPDLQPGDVRMEMLAELAVKKDEPDLAVKVYQKLGIQSPNVYSLGYRAKMQDLNPGDLVGWAGGQEQDGSYIGNIAVWAGEGEIIENVFGHKRRRKLGPTENTFGIPVNMNGEEVPGMGNAPTVEDLP